MLRNLVDEASAKLFLVEQFRDWINYGERFDNYTAYAGVARKNAGEIIGMASGSLGSYIQDAYTNADQFIKSAEQLRDVHVDRAERFRSADAHWSALDKMIDLVCDTADLDIYTKAVVDKVKIINLCSQRLCAIGVQVLDEEIRGSDFGRMLSKEFDDFHEYAKRNVYRE